MKSFSDIDPNYFSGSAIIIDVDGTVVPDKTKEISSSFIDKIKKLSEKNTVYICSNGSSENAREFAKISSVNFLDCRKPFKAGAESIVDKGGGKVVIGDKYITDGLFARNIGAEFIKVKHLRSVSDSIAIRASYVLDDVIYFLIPYLSLARPWQWVKNLLIFAPLFFAVEVFNATVLKTAFFAFLSFCFASSIVYVLNDILDYKADKLHPVKQKRPISSGRVSKKSALIWMAILFLILVGFMYLIPSLWPVIFAYLVINVLYSYRLKHIAVLDILLVSCFYLMRIIAGGISAQVYISPWIIICVFFGAIFVVLGKRRSEYGRSSRRAVLDEYSVEALNFMLAISASLATITYGIWSVLEHNSPYLVYSAIFVVFSLFRIINHIYTNPDRAESPEILVFKDTYILWSFLLWLSYVFWIFYLI